MPQYVDRSRVLITGGNGMIGHAIAQGLRPSHAELDVCDGKKVLAWVQENKPAAIIHLAAVDLSRSEADPAMAFAVNTEGTYQMASVARQMNVPFLFLSSGAVFGGKKGDVHDERSTPHPVNVYGHSKCQAENAVKYAYPKALIIRTGWVFGGSQAHHKKFVDIVLEKARRNEPITAVNDRYGSPTYVVDLVNELWRLLESGHQGLVHVVNGGAATAADISREIVSTMDSSSVVTETTQELMSPHGPKRAISEVLSSKTVTLRQWQQALREYIAS